MYYTARRRVSLANLDWWLLVALVCLAAFGVAMIYSATHGVVDPVVQNRWQAQFIFLLVGIVAFFVGSLFDYRLLGFLGIPAFVIFLAMLILVELSGVVLNGARRWLNIANVNVQPTEAGKFLLIVIMAWFLSRYYTERKRLPVLLLGLAVMALPLFLVYRQPDLGMTITMLFIIGAMVLMSGLPWTQAVILIGAGLVCFQVLFSPDLLGAVRCLLPLTEAEPVCFQVLYNSLQGYMVDRLNVFLDPTNPTNAASAFNVEQALIGVGNGALTGKGWLGGTQNQLFFLRVRHTDFIFSVIAEEFGFLGCVVLLGVVGFVLFRLARTMDQAADEFGRLLVGGVGALILFQVFINVGMNLRLVPVTGMTLPLISSGGSSLISIMFALGLTQSINLRRSA